MKRALLACLLAAAAATSASALAQRHERREHERFGTPHWVFDDRFHHNHYYPAPGYSLAVLPPGNIVINFRSGRFFFLSGVWYQAAPAGFVVVRPPIGIVVPVLPPAYTTVWVGGAPYYYANDVYYVAAQNGYAVSAPPTAPAEAAPPPPAPAAAPSAQGAASSWYYCESAKAYYPYVNECKEGWRQVPATPPR